MQRIALAALLAGAWGAAQAQAKSSFGTGIPASLPADYIANYGHRAKPCQSLVTPPWVSWLTYPRAMVGDEWRVYASNPQLCPNAKKTAYNAIDQVRWDDGAGQNLTLMLAYGLHHHGLTGQRAPRPAGPKWWCQALPSMWGESAWDNARLAHHQGAPQPGDFAAALGPAAGAGFCEKGATRDAQSLSRYEGGMFFSWAPDTTTCRRRYTLKEVPDPNNPGQTTNPPFPANLWGDYDMMGC